MAPTDLQRYFEDLVLTRQLAPASVSLAYNGIRFLYLNVLAWPAVDQTVALPKRPQRIPDLLTRAEVAAILGACQDERYRTMLTVTYGCGSRLSEVLALRVKDVNGEQRLLHIVQGKGDQDRLVPISPTLLPLSPRQWQVPSPPAPCRVGCRAGLTTRTEQH